MQKDKMQTKDEEVQSQKMSKNCNSIDVRALFTASTCCFFLHVKDCKL